MSGLISENVDILIVAETRLIFSMAQFLISGFHHPFPLDISWRSLPHDIMVTKLEASRFVKESLKLISDYLSYRK